MSGFEQGPWCQGPRGDASAWRDAMSRRAMLRSTVAAAGVAMVGSFVGGCCDRLMRANVHLRVQIQKLREQNEELKAATRPAELTPGDHHRGGGEAD